METTSATAEKNGTLFVHGKLNFYMSQAFVKENDDNGLLHQIEPTLPALMKYLQVENNGQRIFLKHTEKWKSLETWVMSNGFSYLINSDNNWEMVL